MMDYWAKPTCPRHQLLLYAPSLDDAISADHPIRELDAVIKELDWSDWESRYNGRRGQPPIHPSLIAGVILYGLLDGLRSSRRLERATHNRIDIIWFLSGITIDHSTFAGFRRKFEKELKGLSRTIVKLALEKANSKLAELAIDGTRVRAWSGRNGARTAECLEKLLTEVETGIGNALEEMKALDAADDPEQASVEELQEEVGRLDGEREKLLKALEVARERDATKQKKEGKGAKAVRVPVTDPDSNIMPNKEGGYAPNYTPTTAVDRDSGVIMDSDVVEANAEADCVLPAVKEAQEAYGMKPERVSCDTGLGSGSNQAALHDQSIEVYTPVSALPPDKNPVWRENPRQPIPEEEWPNLPRRGKKHRQLTRAAFLYDHEEDCYWCPMGEQLEREREMDRKTTTGVVRITSYICGSCDTCPHASECLSRKARYRRVQRDEYEEHRERTARRMNTEQGKEVYKRRSIIAETPFGYIKGVMGIRQFLSRGLNNVRNEWLWVCTAYNLMKLLRPGAAIPAPANAQ